MAFYDVMTDDTTMSEKAATETTPEDFMNSASIIRHL